MANKIKRWFLLKMLRLEVLVLQMKIKGGKHGR